MPSNCNTVKSWYSASRQSHNSLVQMLPHMAEGISCLLWVLDSVYKARVQTRSCLGLSSSDTSLGGMRAGCVAPCNMTKGLPGCPGAGADLALPRTWWMECPGATSPQGPGLLCWLDDKDWVIREWRRAGGSWSFPRPRE